jgi:hypothetical protein
MIQWRGEWRPVNTMLDQSDTETLMVMRAVKAVFYVAEDKVFVAVRVSPGEIVERVEGRDPNLRRWENLD